MLQTGADSGYLKGQGVGNTTKEHQQYVEWHQCSEVLDIHDETVAKC